jgi:hypothetical protein
MVCLWMVYSGSLCENGGVRGASCMQVGLRVVLWGRVQCGQGYGLSAWTGGFSWTPRRIYAMNKGYSVQKI